MIILFLFFSTFSTSCLNIVSNYYSISKNYYKKYLYILFLFLQAVFLHVIFVGNKMERCFRNKRIKNLSHNNGVCGVQDFCPE